MKRLLLTFLAWALPAAMAQPTAPQGVTFQTRIAGVPRVAAAGLLPVRLQLKNLTPAPAFAPIGYPPDFNIVVTNAQGQIVRQRLRPPTLPEGVVTNVVIAPRGPTLNPREVLTVEWTWDLRDDRGQPVRTGRYCLVGMFQSTSGPAMPGLTSAPWCVWVLRSNA
ncbi:hypothetical protein RDMS_00030 [Deinococcus sp. RL]|nr:hypothetical protein RDMS_00030 [Deinococcus sp. RL]